MKGEVIRAPIAVVTDTASGLGGEAHQLLRERLRAALIILLVGQGLAILREILGAFLQEGFYQIDRQAGYGLLNVAVFAAVTVSLVILFLSVTLSWMQLRAIEFVVFGLVIALVAYNQYHEVLHEVRGGDGGLVISTIRSFMFVYFLLMVIYGLLIPNTGLQAARLTISIAVIPLLINLFLYFRHPDFWQVCEEFFRFDQISQSALLMLTGAMTVTYGAHVMYRLRQEASEAKEFGQYKLVEKIGSGGMGEVWRASHRLLVRPAAIKLIRPEMLGSSNETRTQLLSRFEREAQATALLKSPNTVDVHDFGLTEDGILYYVMEFLEGLDLSSLVERYGPVPPERAVTLTRQACESLAEAHSDGLIHRDIKPANIFTCKFGLKHDFVKVLDFGLVKRNFDQEDSRLTAAGTVTGTPAYIAPEMAISSQQADARSDIYSLGCVAYWLVTGFPVFTSDTPMGTILEHVQSDPVPPSERVEMEVPKDFEGIILACLSKSPGDRPQSCFELMALLDTCEWAEAWNQDRARQWWELNRPCSVASSS
jgi:serine/threonine-protein kinase